MHVRVLLLAVIAVTVSAVMAIGAQAQTAAAQKAVVDIPYTKFVLDNGLTLIVHEDHKAPIVAVNMWYHVGSANEKTGKTGPFGTNLTSNFGPESCVVAGQLTIFFWRISDGQQ